MNDSEFRVTLFSLDLDKRVIRQHSLTQDLQTAEEPERKTNSRNKYYPGTENAFLNTAMGVELGLTESVGLTELENQLLVLSSRQVKKSNHNWIASPLSLYAPANT